MKKIFLYCFFFTISLYGISQNALNINDDLGRLAISAFIPQQPEEISDVVLEALTDKLNMVTIGSGLGSDNSRFIITSKITVLKKEITSTAPAMVALQLNLSFYIGDGIEGTKFAGFSTTTKGVGNSEIKAYLSAVKTINTNDQKFKNLIEQGKNKIIEFYNSKCDFIVKQSETLAGVEKYDEAIYNLVSVPEICKDCYDKCMNSVIPIYKKKIDMQCNIALAKAKNVWNAGQNIAAADEVATILSKINPSASCFSEVQKFSNIVSKRILELDKREWNFILKQQQDEVDIRKAAINAAREVGVAFGNNQPKVVYNNTIIRAW